MKVSEKRIEESRLDDIEKIRLEAMIWEIAARGDMEAEVLKDVGKWD